MASLINNLGGTLGFGEYFLVRNDDSYEDGIGLSSIFGAAGLNFFGTNYSYISINNNGNVTLSNSAFGGLSTYTPFGLANGGYAIIAPFFADVDTRLSGGTANANQVAPTAGGTSRGSDLVWYDLDNTGFGTLTVTWDDVGYYDFNTDKLNAFQLQIIGTGGGNFDIAFRYENIDWLTGDASNGLGGLGGTVARAGYSTGDGSAWYELPQSGSQNDMLNLENSIGNTGQSGYYRFSVRSGSEASETITGNANDELISGAGGNDILFGGAGADTLIGNAGNDSLLGGLGDDTYILDNADSMLENVNEGNDSVLANFSFTLPANIENLRLTGTENINASGNSENNVLAGNSGNNILNGLAGVDTVDYSINTSGIIVNLALTTAQAISESGSDTILNIENLIATNFNDTVLGNLSANHLIGGLGNDILGGRGGNDILDGGTGSDTATFNINMGAVNYVRHLKTGGVIVDSSEGFDTLLNIEALSFLDNALITSQQFIANRPLPTYQVATNGVSNNVNPSLYTGPVTFLEYQYLAGALSDTVVASNGNDFINLLGGSDAANGGLGDDVLDGGIGSNFLTGGGDNDTFYLDGRGGTVTWSTITDFNAGDVVNIWGWVAGTSRLLLTQANGGANGFTGATYHYDLDNNGAIDTSITFTGLSTTQVPASQALSVVGNGYLLIG